MSHRTIRRATALLALALWGMARPTAAAKSYAAERFDIAARVLPDRSLAIEERIVFTFEGDYTYVFREIPKDRTDGLRDLQAEMDGVRFLEGTGAGSVEVKEDRAVRVTWHFSPATGPHAFTLRYRLLGVIAQEGGEDVLAWALLPRQHAYRIGEARATLHLPGLRLASPPSVRPAAAQVGVEYAAGGQTAERVVVVASNVGRNDSIRLEVRLVLGALAREAPLWQRQGAARAARGPWLLVVAGLVLMFGFGWLAAIRSAWRRDDTAGSRVPHGALPDPGLPVAFAARLAGRAAPGPAAAVTMIALAARGVIAIDEAPRSRLRGRRFVASLAHEPSGLLPHETAWLDVAFGTSTPRDREVPLETMQRRFAGTRNAFRRAVQGDMRILGLVDPERVAVRASLARAAVVATILTLASIGIAILLVDGFGAWAIAIPASCAVMAIACGIAAGTFSILTSEGERRAVEWRAYFADVRRRAKDKKPDPAPLSADVLPYAVAAGVGAAWVRRLAATPGRYTLPAWFRAAAAAGDDHSAAFVAFLGTHASTAAGDSGGGGGGGGGAAGGGASGAG